MENGSQLERLMEKAYRRNRREQKMEANGNARWKRDGKGIEKNGKWKPAEKIDGKWM